jgi:hypothetical protein
MMGSSGGDSGVDAQGLLAGLLDVVKDDGKTRKRFEELVSLHAANNAVLAECRNAQEAFVQDKAYLADMRAKLVADAAEHAEKASETQARLTSLEGGLKARETAIATVEKDLSLRAAAVKVQEQNLVQAKQISQESILRAQRDAAAEMSIAKDLVDRAHAAKAAELEKYASSLVAKEAKIESALKAAEADKAYWNDKASALKAIIG